MMRPVSAALGTLGAVVLLLGAWWAVRLGYADWLSRKADARAVARAAELAPWNATYRARLASLTGQVGRKLEAGIPALEEAVKLKPGYAAAWIELGLAKEGVGQVAEAERCLMEAARVDRTFEPRWALANFHFRRGEAGKFWEWARRAGEMLHGDARPLFRLCWEMTPDAKLILERVVPSRLAILRQYLVFLTRENHLDGSEAAAERLMVTGGRAEGPLLLDYCTRLLDTGRVESAVRVWNRMAEAGIIAAERLSPEEGASLTNGEFRRDPSGRGFDWRKPSAAGVTLAWEKQDRALRMSFSGEQPEQFECLWQWAPVAAGRSYRLRFEYRTESIPAPGGLGWRVTEAGSWADLTRHTPDLAGEGWRPAEVTFQTLSSTRLVRLALAYKRAPGTARIQGSLWLRGLRLDLER